MEGATRSPGNERSESSGDVFPDVHYLLLPASVPLASLYRKQITLGHNVPNFRILVNQFSLNTVLRSSFTDCLAA